MRRADITDCQAAKETLFSVSQRKEPKPMQKIRKAVIPAAGLGTRMLPISRTVPKEMLPVVDRPAISLLVEEAAAAGAEDILIITGRGNGRIENYFDYSVEYEQKLTAAGKFDKIEEMRPHMLDRQRLFPETEGDEGSRSRRPHGEELHRRRARSLSSTVTT